MSGNIARPVILLAAAIPGEFRRRLDALYEVLGPLPPPFSDTVAALPDADAQRVRALLTMGTVPATRRSMAHLPQLGLISCLGSGYEGVDLAAAAERSIVVTHSPAANASTVADFAMGLLIASVRQFFPANAYLRRGDWKGNAARRMPLVRGLTGRRLGVYGLGAIGERIARRAVAFDMQVGYFNRRARADVDYPYHASLLALATWSDVLMVAVRAEAGNRHAVNAEVLAALGRDGHLVNIARGSVIDESALVVALREGTIAGAGLDVFEHEPVVPDVLLGLPNVVAMPHIGGGTLEAQAAMQDMVWANLDAFFAGRAVLTPVASTQSAPARDATTMTRQSG